MSNPMNIDTITECIGNITDSHRCVFCDKIGHRRYSCGHITCEECARFECLLCITPPKSQLNKQSAPDGPLMERVKLCTELSNSAQELFNINIFQRKRISEKLKVEKELFPDCIQAPIKYTNKRKSLNNYFNSKENDLLPCLPGETTLKYKKKMDESIKIKYVQKWLDSNKNNENLARSPFRDLNLSRQRLRSRLSTKKQLENTFDKENVHQGNKRSVKSLLNDKDKDKFHNKKKKKLSLLSCNSVAKFQDENSKDESGIVIDDEPIIVIHDSQSQKIDKDELAINAVLEAENNQSFTIKSAEATTEFIDTPNSDINETNEGHHKKVPFLKRGFLLDTCTGCNGTSIFSCQYSNEDTGNSDYISITLKNYDSNINIKITDNTNVNRKKRKHSISVQTDIKCEVNPNNAMEVTCENSLVEGQNENVSVMESHNLQSQDLFTEDIRATQTQVAREHTAVIISDSDSDVEQGGGILRVTADIHRSTDNDILLELDKNDISTRQRRAVRAITPASSDSSNKENYDPNIGRKTRPCKKSKKKFCK